MKLITIGKDNKPRLKKMVDSLEMYQYDFDSVLYKQKEGGKWRS